MYLTSYPEFTGAYSVCAAGEMLGVAEPFLEQQMHPTVIIAAFRRALDDIVTAAKDKLRCVLTEACIQHGMVNGLRTCCFLTYKQ